MAGNLLMMAHAAAATTISKGCDGPTLPVLIFTIASLVVGSILIVWYLKG